MQGRAVEQKSRTIPLNGNATCSSTSPRVHSTPSRPDRDIGGLICASRGRTTGALTLFAQERRAWASHHVPPPFKLRGRGVF